MCLMLLLVSLFSISSALGEAPLRQQHAPYAAAGWRPQRPFHLPADYLPPSPRDIEQLRQQSQPHYQVQLSKERVDFAGQVQSNRFNGQLRPAPQNVYLPPSRNRGTDFLKVQRLPQQAAAQLFKPNRPQHQILSQPKPQQQQQQFFNERPPLKAEHPQQFFPVEQQQQQQQFAKPAQQYGAPVIEEQQQQQQHQFPKPAQQYGAPALGQQQQEQFYINYPDPRSAQPDTETVAEVEPAARSAIEALNLAVDTHNHKQEEQQEQRNEGAVEKTRTTQGQYYVLEPDNRLQLVMFTAAQSEEEARSTGGFTAQLKYTPLGEINDPVFKYNGRGQLVRIIK